MLNFFPGAQMISCTLNARKGRKAGNHFIDPTVDIQLHRSALVDDAQEERTCVLKHTSHYLAKLIGMCATLVKPTAALGKCSGTDYKSLQFCAL